MIPLQSQLEHVDGPYADIKQHVDRCGFVLGGNWDYDHGYFDKALDDKQQVWLRVPFHVSRGRLEGESSEANASTHIVFGTPFVLNHLYEEGIDEEGRSGPLRSLIDQFQSPADPDAPLDDHWVIIAREALTELEQAVLS